MTNPIGTGTCNVTFNIPTDERAVLGKLAFQAGAKSFSGFLRSLVLRGLENQNAAAAREVREIRRRYYGGAMLVLFVAGLLCGGIGELRRASSRVRRVEEQREEA